MIDCFESIAVIETWVLGYLYFFNEMGIDLISHELAMMFGEWVVDPVELSNVLHVLEEIKEEIIMINKWIGLNERITFELYWMKYINKKYT